MDGGHLPARGPIAGHAVPDKPERDRDGQTFYNTVFVIGPTGEILGRYRKINTLRVGSEAWSTPGREASTIVVPPIGSVGLLICADAYTPGIVKALKANGAKLLVSPANWAPGFHGPEGVWERATADTGLPLIVCNRTGKDTTLSFVGPRPPPLRTIRSR
jgi:N-carbamoylputrescine amidase